MLKFHMIFSHLEDKSRMGKETAFRQHHAYMFFSRMQLCQAIYIYIKYDTWQGAVAVFGKLQCQPT